MAQLRLLSEILVPLFVIVGAAHVLAIILDAKGIPLNFKAITPNFSKLNPVQGAKQFFSLAQPVRSVEGFATIIAVVSHQLFPVSLFSERSTLVAELW